MTEVLLSATINAAADEVWKTISDFNGLPKFVAAAAKSTVQGEGVGALRTLTLPDGAEIVEKLESFDDRARTLSYSIVSGPLPVEGYVSKMKVREMGAGVCEVEWSSTFTPKGASEEDAQKAIEGIYLMGFEGLKKIFG